MKLLIPLQKIYKNMMYTTNNEIWAYYRIESTSMPVTADKKKNELKNKFRHLLGELKDCGSVDIFMIPQDMTLEERFKELSDSFCKDLPHVANYYSQKTVQLLRQEMGMVYAYDWIIGVPLKSQDEVDSIKDGLVKSYEQMRSQIMGQLGYVYDVSIEDFKKYEETQQLISNKMGLFQGQALSDKEMYYLNRLNFIRNMPHTLDEEASNTTVENITDCVIDPSKRKGVLNLDSIEGKSSIAFLPVSNTPTDISFLHLGELVQTLPFPVELRFKLNYLQGKGTLGIEGTAERSSLRLRNVSKEAREVGNPDSDEIKTSRVVVEDLKNKVGAEKPIVSWLACIVVYGRNEKEVRKRITMVMSLFKGSKKVDVARAQFQQTYLFYQFMMGAKVPASNKRWQQITTIDGFAENLLAINQRVGYKTGWYLGRVDPHIAGARTLQSAIRSSQNIVLTNPFVANKWNERMKTASLHQVITGETGQGKSFLSSLLFIWLSMLDVKGLFIDPKSEKIKQVRSFLSKKENLKRYPFFYELIRSYHLVTLDPDKEENWGVLDPIVFLKGTDAKDTAEAMVYQIVNLDDSRVGQTEVSRFIREVIERRSEGEKVGMLHVINLLREHEEKEVQEIGNLLFERIEGSVLKLGFSDGSVEGLSFEKRITIIGVLGLSVPNQNDDPKFYSSAEKNSLALMISLGKFCEKFGSMNDEEETFEVFEEAWLFNTSSIGKKILNSMKRVGRSQNNMLIYSTQSVSDVTSDDDGGNFGTIFAFNEPKEEGKILEHVKVTDSVKNREWLSGMKKGQCLMYDPYGHVQKISIHSLFPEMEEFLQTVKSTSGSEAEMKFI